MRYLLFSFLPLLFWSCTSSPTPSSSTASSSTASTPTEQAVSLLEAFQTGDTAALRSVHPTLYKQHDLAVADGVEGLRGAIVASAATRPAVRVLRTFQDADFVFTQTLTRYPDSTELTFDIFRFAEGRIVAHWDNTVRFPTPQDSAALETFVGKIAPVTDRDKTEANRALVTRLAKEVLLDPDYTKFMEFVDTVSYTEHNPYIQEGMFAYMNKLAREDTSFTPSRIHKVLADGDYVLLVTERESERMPLALYDLFRLSGGKVVEHWNILSPVPPRSEWKNPNGAFGF